MNNSGKVVCIVHHIDTEGPLHEPIQDVFARLEAILGMPLNLSPTYANLKRLQDGTIDGLSKTVQDVIRRIADPHLLDFKSSWAEVDEMLLRMLSKEYRDSMKDSFGNGWVYNWHILDHVGFLTNERRRDIGYLNIFNHYQEIIRETNSTQDGLHWHFHPIPFTKEAHIPATSYENSYWELHQVLCRRLIEKKWFPRVNRAGFHTIRPDSNFFLEQWIPFDASNQSSVIQDGQLQKDAINGRFGDWNGAPSDWAIYHPDLYDWRKEGSMKRFIARCLNLRTRFRNINEIEIISAFEKAEKSNSPVYLGVTNHDFREMSVEIEAFFQLLSKVSQNYSNVKFRFCEAVEAFREVIGFNKAEVESNKVEVEAKLTNNLLTVQIVKGEIFGSQPYLALKTKLGHYHHDNFDFGEFGKQYYYTFDRNTIGTEVLSSIVVAVNDKYGNSSIAAIDPNNGAIEYFTQ